MKPKKSNCQTGRNHILVKRETTSAHPKLRKYVYTNFYYYYILFFSRLNEPRPNIEKKKKKWRK
jgi:hypothetical protein